MDRGEFYKIAVQPEFQDEMVFQVQVAGEKRHRDRTFSFEAIDGMADQIRDFLLARVHGRWKKTGVGPSDMSIEVRVKWSTKSDAQLERRPLPWFSVEDKGETLLDGEYRERAKWEGPS